MRCSTVGSCLSELTASFLASPPIENFRYLRSDFVLEILRCEGYEYYSDLSGDLSTLGVPSELVEQAARQLAPELPNNSHINRMKRTVSFHSHDKFSKMKGVIGCSDFVILDNNYDLWSKLQLISFGSSYSALFSNLNAVGQSVERELAPLSDSEMVKFTTLVVEEFKRINPNIKIFFVNYPVTGFRKRGKPGDIRRVKRCEYFSSILKGLVEKKPSLSHVYFIDCLDLPASMLSDKGVLYFKDEVYQTFAKLIEALLNGQVEGRYFDDFSALQGLVGIAPTSPPSSLASTPYSDLPASQYWKPAVAEPYPLAITDLYRKKFDIGIDDAVATCGSCFAQHIGKRLDRKGYNYLDVEPVPEDLPTDKSKSLGYGIYSARYGNVYTSRQLLQLFKRAFGEIEFDEVWKDKAGRYVDPFRPNLCGEGYSSAEEVLYEQRQHLKKVRQLFETLDVFVFTMGVTETWVNSQTGAVYPICPGVTAGTFDSDQHEFVNLDYATIVEEIEAFLSSLREVNPNAKVLLTVSPVPLTATAEDRHVLLSTMASKSILRAVVDQLYRRHEHVDYFPSYDIIMSPPFKSMFFKSNLRSIHEEGVDYVMSHFFAEHRLEGETDSKENDSAALQKASALSEEMEEDDEAFCDEAFLELERRTGD